MSNFVEKIGEKLHIGGHKKEGEHEHPPPQHVGEHPPHEGELGGHAQPHAYGGYPDQHASHAEHGYGGELGHVGFATGGHVGEHGHAGYDAGHVGEHEHAGYAGGVHGEHGGHYDQHGVGAPPPPQHEGPVEKVKHKVKAKKHDGGDSSSSSSSESDGEGGRRKKKHGIF